jgi:flagellar hook-length control protein FliK
LASLLAMLAPGTGTDAAMDTADRITSTDFASLIDTLKMEATSPPEKPADADADSAGAPPESPEATPVAVLGQLAQSAEGKSLLKDLGGALIALDDALEAGRPVDPALDRKLGETLDALAVYLGIVIPAAPAVDPGITALASGEGVLPGTPAQTLPPAAPVPADTATAPTAPATPAAEVPSESEATTPEEAPEALRQLGLEIGKLTDRLTEQDPELARKLGVLADKLLSGAAPGGSAAASSLDAELAGEIERITAALAEPRPKAAIAAAAQPFTPPALELLEAVAPARQAGKATPETAPAPDEPLPAATLEAPDPRTSIDKPAITPRGMAEVTPDEPEPTSTAPASAPAPAQNADTGDAASAAAQPVAAQAARNIHAAYQAPVQQVNLPQVAFEVVRQFEAGNSRFQIRLDPPELGRIDVKLDVDKSGAVNARMTVERPETLDLMQRDQRALQLALQQAGLDASKTNLEFSLRQNPFAQQGGMTEGRGGQPAFTDGDGAAADEGAATELATTTYRGAASAGGVNLFV